MEDFELLAKCYAKKYEGFRAIVIENLKLINHTSIDFNNLASFVDSELKNYFEYELQNEYNFNFNPGNNFANILFLRYCIKEKLIYEIYQREDIFKVENENLLIVRDGRNITIVNFSNFTLRKESKEHFILYKDEFSDYNPPKRISEDSYKYLCKLKREFELEKLLEYNS